VTPPTTTVLRPSRVLRQLRAGQQAASLKLNIPAAEIVEVAGLNGFDAVWLDAEHCPGTIQHFAHMVRAGKVFDVDAIVRVPRGSYSDLIRPLEIDAAGVMVPHCMSASDAQAIAWQTKFHPIGRRAVDGGNADGAYCSVPVTEYHAHANAERLTIVQIEDPEPLAELDAIAAVPGIDMLFFGPGDFSHAIGKAGQPDAAEVVAAREAVVQAAKRHGKWAGTVVTPNHVEEYAAMGYHLLNVGSDVGGLMDHATDATFVTLLLAGLWSTGLVPWPLPLLVAAAFLQYMADSRALSGRTLRASWLGRVNGIGYFVLAAVLVYRNALGLGLPGDAAIEAFAWLLVLSTVASMLHRARAWLSAR